MNLLFVCEIFLIYYIYVNNMILLYQSAETETLLYLS